MKKIKSLLSLFAWFLVLMSGFSQPLQINLNINPPYSPFLNDYLSMQGNTFMSVTNSTPLNESIKFHLTLTSTNGISITTKPGFTVGNPAIVPGNRTIQVRGLLGGSSVFEEGDYDLNLGQYDKDQLLRLGLLPEGTYTLCIKALDNTTDEVLSQTVCRQFNIRYSRPPQTILPACASNVNYSQLYGPNFQWTPTIGLPGSNIVYDLYILQKQDGVRLEDALNAAIRFGQGNPIIQRNLATTSFSFNSMNGLLPQGEYIYAIKAKDLNNKAYITNQGISNFCKFNYGNAGGGGNDNTIIGGFNSSNLISYSLPLNSCSCTLAMPSTNTTANSQLSVSQGFTAASFNVAISQVTVGASGLASGEGTVQLPLANSNLVPLRVRFDSVVVNSEFKMFKGKVVALKNSEAPSFLPNSNSPNSILPTTPSGIDQLEDYLSYPGRVIEGVQSYGNSIGFEMPLGYQLSSSPYLMAFTDLRIYPQLSVFDALAILPIPEMLNDGRLVFSVSNQCVNSSQFCTGGKMFLAEDIAIPGLNATVKASQPNALIGTYVKYSSKGFDTFNLHIFQQIPGLKKKANNQPMVVDFIAHATDWSDWIAELSFEPFYIDGLQDFVFKLPATKKLYFDKSSSRNVAKSFFNTPFSSGDPADQAIPVNLVTWEGFYFEAFEIQMPGALNFGNNQPLVVTAENMIFDDGLSCKLLIKDIFNFGDRKKEGWQFSLDTVKLSFFKNAMKSGYMGGQLSLPLDANSTLGYSGSFQRVNGMTNYQFNVRPKNDLHVDIWAADLVLYQDSYFNLTYGSPGQNATNANQELNAEGNIHAGIEIQISDKPTIALRAIEVQNLLFTTVGNEVVNTSTMVIGIMGNEVYNGNQSGNNPPMGGGGGPNFLAEDGYGYGAAGSDDDSSMGSFPLSLGITPIVVPESNGVRVGFKFDAGLQIAEIEVLPTANVVFSITGFIDTNDPNNSHIEAPQINSVVIEDGNLGFATIERGEITFLRDDDAGQWGEGISGSLKVTFIQNMSASMNVIFGKTSGFRYFGLDARVMFGVNSPVIGGMLKWTGIGGGFYWNLIQKTPTLEGIAAMDSTIALHNLLQPSQHSAYFKIEVMMSSTDGKVLNALGKIYVTIANGALYNLGINVKGVMFATDPAALDEAPAKFEATIEYVFPDRTFSADATVSINFNEGLVTGQATMSILISPDAWHFKIGEFSKSTDPNLGTFLRLDAAIAMIELSAYFYVGNDALSIPERLQEVLAQISDGPPGKVKGVMMGAAFQANSNLKFLVFYLNLEAHASFDLAFIDITKECADRDMGVNKFYALGAINVGGSASFGLVLDLWFVQGKFEAGSISFDAGMKYGGPNPTFMEGWIRASFSILDGLISGTMNFHAKYEPEDKPQACPPPINPFAGLPLIDKIVPESASEDDKVSIASNIKVTTNYDISKSYYLELLEAGDHSSYPVSIPVQVRVVLSDIKIKPKSKPAFIHTGSTMNTINGTVNASNMYINGHTAAIIENKHTDGFDGLRINSEYNVSVTAKGYMRRNNGLFQIVPAATQSEVRTFYTSGCEDIKLENEVALSYPYPNQRFFLVKETNKGFLRVSNPAFMSNNCFGNIGVSSIKMRIDIYDHNKKFIKKVYSPTSITNNINIEFDLPPDLPTSAYLRFRLVRKTPDLSPVASVQIVHMDRSDSTRLMMQSNRQSIMNSTSFDLVVDTSSTVDADFNNMTASSKFNYLKNSNELKWKKNLASVTARPLETVLYDFMVHTSYYKTSEEKANTISKAGGAVCVNAYGTSGIDQKFNIKEGLDKIDVAGHVGDAAIFSVPYLMPAFYVWPDNYIGLNQYHDKVWNFYHTNWNGLKVVWNSLEVNQGIINSYQKLVVDEVFDKKFIQSPLQAFKNTNLLTPNEISSVYQVSSIMAQVGQFPNNSANSAPPLPSTTQFTVSDLTKIYFEKLKMKIDPIAYSFHDFHWNEIENLGRALAYADGNEDELADTYAVWENGGYEFYDEEDLDIDHHYDIPNYLKPRWRDLNRVRNTLKHGAVGQLFLLSNFEDVKYYNGSCPSVGPCPNPSPPGTYSQIYQGITSLNTNDLCQSYNYKCDYQFYKTAKTPRVGVVYGFENLFISATNFPTVNFPLPNDSLKGLLKTFTVFK